MAQSAPTKQVARHRAKAHSAVQGPARKISPRRIKPDNLFVLKDERLEVLDFGIARLRTAGTHVRTRTGMALGTPSYMSPEQVKGVDVDHRTDLFGARRSR
jgi:serine/threonine-protein kinase